MQDSPIPYPSGSWRGPRRGLRPPSPSPARTRLGDDRLLSRITPRSAVDMLRQPPPLLKATLELASTSDREFALRAAVASRKIQDWLDEMSEWYWPVGGGSTGFEVPKSKRRKAEEAESPSIRTNKGRLISVNEPIKQLVDDSDDDDFASYKGCLREDEVTTFEQRLDEIDHDMKELDIEDIKRYVLLNHIMPLSRPGTPLSDTRSTTSTMSLSKMDDLTAVVTAIVVQALPNLSKLTRMMAIWSVRLMVLSRASGFLEVLKAAEDALKSAWNVVSIETRKAQADEGLTKENFETMKKALLPRISEAAHCCDGLLDILEGAEETLPASWVERMDAVEKSSGEWIAACEQHMRESNWAKILDVSKNSLRNSRSPSVATTLVVSDRGDSNKKGTPKSMPSTKTKKVDIPDIEISRDATQPASPVEIDSPVDSLEYLIDETLISDILSYENDLAVLEEEEEDQVLPGLRRDSAASQASTLTSRHEFASIGERTPELARTRATDEQLKDDISLPSSPPLDRRKQPSRFKARDYGASRPRTPVHGHVEYVDDSPSAMMSSRSQNERSDAQLQQQINEILESIPAKIRLAAEPASAATLNPPDLPIQRVKQTKSDTATPPSRTTSSLSSRAGTPSFTLVPAYARAGNSRASRSRTNSDIKLYHLSRNSGEAPIKLFIRCVGERGERVMVRVGGGWADLGEYLKEYATHHRRAGPADASKIEVRGLSSSTAGHRPPSRSSPSSRPGSALSSTSPMTPLAVRKTRRSIGANEAAARVPLASANLNAHIARGNSPTGSCEGYTRSRSSSWSEEDSSLGLAGPNGRKVEISPESRAWVESVKEKVRLASGERRVSASNPNSSFSEDRPGSSHRSKNVAENRLGDLGKVGSTKRLFRKSQFGN